MCDFTASLTPVGIPCRMSQVEHCIQEIKVLHNAVAELLHVVVIAVARARAACRAQASAIAAALAP